MKNSSVAFLWKDPDALRHFGAAVCLHGHTMFSEECLDFLPRYLKYVPGVSQVVSRYERNRSVDFARAYWTPPLTPATAFRLEHDQIAHLGLRPMISLTNHDTIEASVCESYVT